VDVIGHAANFDGRHLVLTGDATQKRPESILQWRRDERTALLGTEDAMEIGAHIKHAPIHPSLIQFPQLFIRWRGEPREAPRSQR
jgi:hypothetical protein